MRGPGMRSYIIREQKKYLVSVEKGIGKGKVECWKWVMLVGESDLIYDIIYDYSCARPVTLQEKSIIGCLSASLGWPALLIS